MRREQEEELWSTLEPIVIASGCELVDLEIVQGNHVVLRITIDKPDLPLVEGIGVAPGNGVTLDECTSVSRQMSALLDVEDLIPFRYTLEVTSPGVQRPVRKATDFAKFEGYPIQIKTEHPIESSTPDSKRPPSRNFKGTLGTLQDGTVSVSLQEGDEVQIPLTAIVRARLDPDMDEWLALATKARKKA